MPTADEASVDAVQLSLFSNRMAAVCDEMGAVLQRSAFSPNIRDRLDFSCAIFDADGNLCAQAAHIPVHLGSMAFAMAGLVSTFDWADGDMVVVNDPYLGGTHLPDVTLVAPLIIDGRVIAFVANRAHHADIGAETPGSMPVSVRLDQEGLLLAPQLLCKGGELCRDVMQTIRAAVRSPATTSGDFEAQTSANRQGLLRLRRQIDSQGASEFERSLAALNAYGERLAANALSKIPDGTYRFSDVMDDDGVGTSDINISATVCVQSGRVEVDFSGTDAQVAGNLNAPLSVAVAGVFYVFRSLMPADTPACEGTFRRIRVSAPEGCLLNARRPAAVAAGNVETSTRVVDVILGALAQALPDKIPAASHGSMNNLAMGSGDASGGWDYYETIGGGMGAGARGGGQSAIQTHMTNTLNTPIEVLEQQFPIRIRRYAVRRGSGGGGLHAGGDGLVRSFEFLRPATATLLSERRRHAPWGLAGGRNGACGENLLNGKLCQPKATLQLNPGDCLEIRTPGGGGWGVAAKRD